MHICRQLAWLSKIWIFLHLHLLLCKQWSELLIKHRLFHLQARILFRLLSVAAAGEALSYTPLADTEYLHHSAAAHSPHAATAFAKSYALGGSNGVLCTEVQQHWAYGAAHGGCSAGSLSTQE